MSDDDVGYGKPPKHSRFKPGNNANPKGRPKREPSVIAEIIDNVLSALAEYHERGRIKRARRRELTIKTHVKLALGGDLKSIETLLMLRVNAQISGDADVHRLDITDWLPDYPGQTGEQKTREFAVQGNIDVPAWWKDAEAKAENKNE